DRRAGQISDISKNVPGWLSVAFAQAELRLDVSEQPRSARMQNPALDLLALPAVAVEETLYQPADLSADHFRNILCQQDEESGIAQIKSHGAQRIGKRIGFRDENLGPLHLFSADHHGCGAVAKEDRRNQVRL